MKQICYMDLAILKKFSIARLPAFATTYAKATAVEEGYGLQSTIARFTVALFNDI
ncbi:MAG: hypothetical protein R6W81_14775 [Bacteroidales bacterium]